MANVYDFLGADGAYFMKSSWQVYCNASGTRQYIGKTSAEKTFTPTTEFAEYWDNESGVQTLYALGISKFDLLCEFQSFQPLDPNIISIAWNGDLDTSDSVYNRIFLGSAPNNLGEYEWRFVGQGKTGLAITFVVRKGIVVPSGGWTSGAAGAWGSIGMQLRCLQDTSITNTKRDIAYFEIQKKALS